MPTSTDSRRPDTGYLTVQGLTAGYGAAPIISDISLTVAEGEVVTVIGPARGRQIDTTQVPHRTAETPGRAGPPRRT